MTRGSNRRRPPAVVELVGPAGAGKTALLDSLRTRSDRIVAGVHPARMSYVLHLAGHFGRFLPAFIGSGGRGRWFTWAETRAMIYLSAWRGSLERSRNGPLTIFDHGPVFRLTTLQEFGPQVTRSATFARWWDRTLDDWSRLIDQIVWLDAEDDVLLRRVRSRDQTHVIKDVDETEARRFLYRYRRAYIGILERLATDKRVEVIRYDTGVESLESISERVLAGLGLGSEES